MTEQEAMKQLTEVAAALHELKCALIKFTPGRPVVSIDVDFRVIQALKNLAALSPTNFVTSNLATDPKSVSVVGVELHEDRCEFERIKYGIETGPMTYVPALFQILVKRAATEPIFRGKQGLFDFIGKAYARHSKGKVE